MLLAADANVDARSSGLDKTPLFQAAFENRIEIAQLLLDHGADVNAVDALGRNALREAILAKHTEMVELLLQAGCNPRQKDTDGNTMADIAEKYGTAEVKARFVDAKK